MAKEYKLSYTAAEIDERLGQIDNIVKTVNGVAPDESGNVKVDIPEGASVQSDWNQHDEAQPNAILNRPFGYYPTGADTVTWDLSTDGRESFSEMMYKVNDSVLTLSDFADGFSVVSNGVTIELTSASAIDMEGEAIAIYEDPTNPEGIPLAMIVNEAGAVAVGCSPGVYFLYFDLSELGGAVMAVSQLTIPGHAVFGYNKTIEKKFLPPITDKDIPYKKFYINFGEIENDIYLYKDYLLTQKAEKKDITASTFIVGAVVSAEVSPPIWYFPTAFFYEDDYATVVLLQSTHYYTAEYTPKTTT